MFKKTVRGMALVVLVFTISMLALNIHRAMAVSIYDLDGDGKVDIKDVGIVSAAFGSVPGHPKWDLKADVNSDGKIDIVDMGLVASHFGDTS